MRSALCTAFLLLAGACGHGSGNGSNMGTYLGSCDYNGGCGSGVCEDFYSGSLPAMPSAAVVKSTCDMQQCSSGSGAPKFLSSPCPSTDTTGARTGSCFVPYTEEDVRYYPPTPTTGMGSAQTQCTELGATPGGSTFTAN